MINTLQEKFVRLKPSGGGGLSKRSPPTHPKKVRIFINTIGGKV